jgi:hypothetical protein
MQNLRGLGIHFALVPVFLFLVSTGSTAKDPHGTWQEQVRLRFGYAKWPKDERVACGFEFQKEDYPTLATFRVVTDSQSVEMVPVTGNPVRALWHVGEAGYKATVTRTIQMASDTHGRLVISIVVAPSVAQAHSYVVDPWLGAQSLPDVVLGTDHGVNLGDITILRDPPAQRNEWDGTTSSSFFFFRNNVLIDVSGTKDPALSLIALGRELDTKIKEQQQNANPTRLQMAFEVSAPAVRVRDFRPDFGQVGVTWKATWNGDPGKVRIKAFSTRESANFRPVTDPDNAFQMEPDPEHPRTYTSGDLRFDNTDKPTRIEQITNGKHGKYHVGVIGWGPNLLPAFAYAELEVDGNDG